MCLSLLVSSPNTRYRIETFQNVNLYPKWRKHLESHFITSDPGWHPADLQPHSFRSCCSLVVRKISSLVLSYLRIGPQFPSELWHERLGRARSSLDTWIVRGDPARFDPDRKHTDNTPKHQIKNQQNITLANEEQGACSIVASYLTKQSYSSLWYLQYSVAFPWTQKVRNRNMALITHNKCTDNLESQRVQPRNKMMKALPSNRKSQAFCQFSPCYQRSLGSLRNILLFSPSWSRASRLAQLTCWLND